MALNPFEQQQFGTAGVERVNAASDEWISRCSNVENDILDDD